MKSSDHDSRRIVRRFLYTTTGLLTLFAGEPLIAQTSLRLLERMQSPPALQTSPEGLRSAAVNVNIALLRSRDNSRFSLLLPDGNTVNVTKSTETRTPAGLVWHGKIVNQPTSSVSFSIVNETAVGSILTGRGQSFRLRRDASGVQVIEEVDLSKLPPEGDPTPVPGRRGGDSAGDTCATDGPDQIDVMVVYTQAALTGASSKEAMEADIYLAVEQSNQSYFNSNINQRLRLVHIAEVSYVESGDVMKDRDRLKDKADGYVDNVHTLRDTFGADVVAMITERVEGVKNCGYSFTMETVGNAFEDSAFSVVLRQCAVAPGVWSFTHELAHIMSARHDWYQDPTNNAPFSYNHGHVQAVPTSGTPFRTMMAYPSSMTDPETNPCALAAPAGVNPAKCPRVLNFSNPNVNVGGNPTGIGTGSQQEDNHRALNETALTVANFRCSSPGRDDVWMKDTWSDTGQEPDPAQASLPMWESPYIWARTTQDTLLIHQHEHMNPIKDQPNFIYVKIHNGGAATSGNLEVSFADASTGLTWPADWTMISSVPVASFDAHTTKIIEVPWTPAVEGHYCLIARWISASDPMTTLEGSSIEANVRGNNNIIWHNVNVVDLGGDSSADAVFMVQNASKEGNISLIITPRPPKEQVSPPWPTFLDFGQVALQLDDKLMAAWRRTGFSGSGFKRSGSTVTVTAKKGAVLNLGRVDPKLKAPVKISFVRPKTGQYPMDEFLIRVMQTDGAGKAYGGASYQISSRRP